MTTRAVLVTTAHKGVFFGYVDTDAYTVGDATIRLTAARLCVYWSADMKGFMGLAAFGPSKTCRIGPPADIELRDLTAIVDVAASAIQKWDAAPWSNS